MDLLKLNSMIHHCIPNTTMCGNSVSSLFILIRVQRTYKKLFYFITFLHTNNFIIHYELKTI